jgi:hypothetical protein
MPHQHVALSSVATQTIRHCVGAGNLISKGSASRLKAGNPARSMDCPRGFFRNPSVTRLLGIRTFLKAATQRMSAHTTARESLLFDWARAWSGFFFTRFTRDSHEKLSKKQRE